MLSAYSRNNPAAPLTLESKPNAALSLTACSNDGVLDALVRRGQRHIDVARYQPEAYAADTGPQMCCSCSHATGGEHGIGIGDEDQLAVAPTAKRG